MKNNVLACLMKAQQEGRIKGVYGREMFTTWRKMLGLLKAGLDLSPLITHRLPIDDFEAGFAAMRSGEAGKVVMDWG